MRHSAFCTTCRSFRVFELDKRQLGLWVSGTAIFTLGIGTPYVLSKYKSIMLCTVCGLPLSTALERLILESENEAEAFGLVDDPSVTAVQLGQIIKTASGELGIVHQVTEEGVCFVTIEKSSAHEYSVPKGQVEKQYGLRYMRGQRLLIEYDGELFSVIATMRENEDELEVVFETDLKRDTVSPASVRRVLNRAPEPETGFALGEEVESCADGNYIEGIVVSIAGSDLIIYCSEERELWTLPAAEVDRIDD